MMDGGALSVRRQIGSNRLCHRSDLPELLSGPIKPRELSRGLRSRTGGDVFVGCGKEVFNHPDSGGVRSWRIPASENGEGAIWIEITGHWPSAGIEIELPSLAVH